MKDYYDKNDYDEDGNRLEKQIEVKESKNNLKLKFCKNDEVNKKYSKQLTYKA